MGPLLFYLLKSACCLTIFHLLFRIFFRRDTLFRANRVLLLVGTWVCAVLPFIELDGVGSGLWQQPVSAVRHLLVEEERDDALVGKNSREWGETAFSMEVPAFRQMIGKEAYPVRGTGRFPWIAVLGILYMVGAACMLFFFLFSTWRMFELIRRYPRHDCGKYQLVVCPEKLSSFSWGKFIVLSQEDYDNCADEVLLHEQMHLRYRHTLDLLWMEVLLVVQWFNPIAWLLMRDLRELHEFEADNGVLTYGIDATQYQLLLVKKSVGTRLYSMANGFNHSKLKNRINMMLKRRTNSWARLKVMLFVPVAAGTLMAFAQPEVKETVAQMVKPECTTTGTGVRDSLGYDEWELLEQYFQRKAEEAYPGKTAESWEGKGLWRLCVNINNKMMLGGDFVSDVSDLRLRWTKILRQGYREAVNTKDRQKLPKMLVLYDAGALVSEMRSYLQIVKEVYEEVHSEIAAQAGGMAEAQLDDLLPVAVYISNPAYKNVAKYRTPSDVPLPIEVTFLRSDGNPLSETLKNLTLDELTQAVIRYKGKSQNMTISIKAGDNAKMAVMNDAKGIIREIYSE